MGTALNTKKLQITAFGIEKIVPNREALGVFTRLLARSATGQPTTTYTSHYRSPRKGGELHIIIVDNGRSRLLADDDHRKVLALWRLYEYVSRLSPFRRLCLYLFHTWPNRHQLRYGQRPCEVQRQCLCLFLVLFLPKRVSC